MAIERDLEMTTTSTHINYVALIAVTATDLMAQIFFNENVRIAKAELMVLITNHITHMSRNLVNRH